MGYQEKHEEDEFDYTNRLRNKFSLAFDTDTDVEPVVFAETFSNIRAIPIDNSKFRVGLGLEIDVYKRMDLSLDYVYQRDFISTEQIEHIARVKYQVKVPKKKNKDVDP